jgi:hypothetical protein
MRVGSKSWAWTHWRKRGDLITAYKVVEGKDRVDPATWFTMCRPADDGVTTRRQGGYRNVEANKWRGEIRRNFWSVRVVDPWNSLPDEIKQQDTLNGFKNSLDNFNGWGGQQNRRPNQRH